MNGKVSARKIWETTLFFAQWEQHTVEMPGIIEHLYELRSNEEKNIASGVAPGAKPEYGIFESKFNLFTDQHPGIQKLKSFIGDRLCATVGHMNNVDPSKVRVSATESWFHITNDGGYHDGHHHHDCSWCGIYYVQAGDVKPPDANAVTARDGVNRFFSPLASGGAYCDLGNEYLKTGNFDITPEDGMLVLFPSYLLHSALPYSGEQDRIVIAFNTKSFRAE